MQASSSVLSTTTVGSSTAAGPWQVLRHTLQQGGIRALYTGLGLPLAAQALYKSAIFTSVNITQEWILDYKHFEQQKLGLFHGQPVTLSYADRFLCGFTAGAVNAAVFVTPVEFVRNQLITHHHNPQPSAVPTGQPIFRNSWDVIRHVRTTQPEGVRALWRGTSWAVARDAGGCGCFFYALAATQDVLMTTRGEEKPSIGTSIISGGVAGMAFWVAGLPLDTIKTWVQSSDIGAARTTSPMDALRRIYHEGGGRAVVGRLFRGWQVAYGRGIPSAAITVSVYSWVYGQVTTGSIP
jgi:solute carrier family 25 carnitine/acylcarnitine transporter 20/29